MEVGAQFGGNLRKARREAGLTQDRLAAEVFLHRSGISAMERGQRVPRVDDVLRLAEGVGVEARDLLHGIM